MALTSQQKRISKNRVSITYDVETNGSSQKKELPFIVGVIGGYSGDREDRPPVEDRSFHQVTKDNLNTVMAQIAPRLKYTVPNMLEADGSEIEVDLDFKSMSDFEPDAIVNKVPALKNLIEIREQLMTILGKADRSRELEKLLREILQNENIIKELGSELNLPAPAQGE